MAFFYYVKVTVYPPILSIEATVKETIEYTF